MGGGYYDEGARTSRAIKSGYHTKNTDQIFEQKTIYNEMNPKDVLLRESRDSEEHPESYSIILALDDTGSMNRIPTMLIRDGLPKIMSNIIQHGIKHPQLLFLAVGDHVYDEFPLQVGQFESNDELLDKWLTKTYLEKGGGANDGESYMLAWYFAAKHTSIDCFEKRNKKGVLITIGDEKCLSSISDRDLTKIMGNLQHKSYTSKELLDLAKEKYNVYHLHMIEGNNGKDVTVKNQWKNLLGENLIFIDNVDNVADEIANIVYNNYNVDSTYVNNEVNEVVSNKDEIENNDAVFV